MTDFTFTLTDYEVSNLLWLVEGNNAFDALAAKLAEQLEAQQ